MAVGGGSGERGSMRRRGEVTVRALNLTDILNLDFGVIWNVGTPQATEVKSGKLERVISVCEEGTSLREVEWRSGVRCV
jgi:hypothetical protein